ncbi:DUF1819 family protein [Roseimaritima sediminicola]|uniref:DUF1819 family protein n=1 Tax=Roseimaritima sediminicola TaxID=2662066 RepID=UPI00129840C6|nr:DUF1819 family protein [Roseimaritima sediminicola]
MGEFPLFEQMMVATPYVLSFTAGGLLYHESLVVAEELLRARFDWKVAIKAVQDGNLLQSRTESTAKRKLREVRNRLQALSRDEIQLLAEGGRQEQKLILWLACCLKYQILADFARDVLRSKYLQLDLSLDRDDVDRFIDNKTIWHEELEKLAPSTRTKLQTVMLRMLRESEMLSPEGAILPPIFSENLTRVIRDDSPEHFLLFPTAVPE